MANKKMLRFLGNNLIVPLVNVLCKTLKIKEHNKPDMNIEAVNGNNFIFAFWHGTMLVPWYVLRNYLPTAIISQSKDGELLAKLLKKWNYDLKRGSSSRDGKAVLEELVKSAVNNKSIAITPDGPRGPRQEMKAGAIVISKKAQVPVVLIGVFYSKKIELNSWDRFEIPYIFSSVNLIYSDPILIEKDLSYNETDIIIKKLEVELNDLQKESETLC
jgi:hypothetical protein